MVSSYCPYTNTIQLATDTHKKDTHEILLKSPEKIQIHIYPVNWENIFFHARPVFKHINVFLTDPVLDVQNISIHIEKWNPELNVYKRVDTPYTLQKRYHITTYQFFNNEETTPIVPEYVSQGGVAFYPYYKGSIPLPSGQYRITTEYDYFYYTK